MNLKKAKRIRKILKYKQASWREAVYVDSPLPKEKPHQKMYPLNLVEWTKGGVKNIVKHMPIKVGTLRLGTCGRQVYKRAKRIAHTF